MADSSSPIEFEDVPLEEARRMGRGPRMDPRLSHALKEKMGVENYSCKIPDGASNTAICRHSEA
jgi:hypothetical protein